MILLSAQVRIARSLKNLEKLGLFSPSTQAPIRPEILSKEHQNHIHYVRNKTPNNMLAKN